MKHEYRFGAHIGTSSLLLIFLTLSLVSFGALSLAGAKADERLSEKLLEHTAAYYAAAHEAEAFVAATDEKLREAWEASADAGDFAARADDYRNRTANIPAEAAVPLNDAQTLAVELEFLLPATPADNPSGGAATSVSPPDGRLCRITKWRIEVRDDASYERHLPVSGSGGLD